MKRRDQIIQVIALLVGLGGLSVYCIRHGTWGYSLLVSFAVVLIYTLFMDISWKASAAMVALPYSARPNYRALIPLSLKIALPLYFCLFCIACIPLFRWELWLLTGFPTLLLLSTPLYSIMGELKDRRFPRGLYLCIQLVVIALLYAAGQMVSWLAVRFLFSQ